MEGQDGLAYAYNEMKLHAELLEREVNFLQAKLWRAKKMVAYPLRAE